MKTRMRASRSARALIGASIAAFLMPASALAQANTSLPVEPPATSRSAAAFDVLVLRPLGLIVLPVGVAAFIPVALLTAPNGIESVQSAMELFVTRPASYVFKRPLGEF